MRFPACSQFTAILDKNFQLPKFKKKKKQLYSPSWYRTSWSQSQNLHNAWKEYSRYISKASTYKHTLNAQGRGITYTAVSKSGEFIKMGCLTALCTRMPFYSIRRLESFITCRANRLSDSLWHLSPTWVASLLPCRLMSSVRHFSTRLPSFLFLSSSLFLMLSCYLLLVFSRYVQGILMIFP